MKKTNFFKSILALSIASLSLTTQAQEGVSQLIKSGPDDARKLAEAYFEPAFKGLGFGMNSAWFNSAKTKNLGKFDLKIQVTGANVPNADQSFDIRSLGLSNNTRLRNPSNFSTPTAFGDDNQGTELVLYDDNNREVGSFNMPSGTGLNFVPSPQVQLTVGLIKNTEISLRYSPEIGKNSNYGTIQVIGFGAKHEITKLILPGKTEKIIPIDIALAFGYNQITYDYQFKPEDQVDDSNSGRDLNQRIDAKLSGFTVDAILSKKLAIFTPFISVGYNSAQSKVGLLGEYIVQTGFNTVGGIPTTPSYSTFDDPVNIKKTDISGIRGSLGFSLHLAFFRLYGAYSIGQYSAFTGGFGFGIGK